MGQSTGHRCLSLLEGEVRRGEWELEREGTETNKGIRLIFLEPSPPMSLDSAGEQGSMSLGTVRGREYDVSSGVRHP